MFRCDKQCCERSLSCRQSAPVVIYEGEKSYTTNLCQKCFNKSLNEKRRQATDKCAVETGCGKKSVPWKDLRMMGKSPYVRGMWEYCFQERARVQRFRELTDEEKQAGIQGQWQLESPAREYLEQVKFCHDKGCTERMMKKVFAALKGGGWEEFFKTLSGKK